MYNTIILLSIRGLNETKLRKDLNSFKRDLKSLLLRYSFNSVDEFMSYESSSM
jgi:hypothetical protein